MEAEAVVAILNVCRTGHDLIGSEVTEYEIARIADDERMRAVMSLLHYVEDIPGGFR
jgi:hypothetical protein